MTGTQLKNYVVKSSSEKRVSLLLSSNGRSFGNDSKTEWLHSEVEVEAIAILNE